MGINLVDIRVVVEDITVVDIVVVVEDIDLVGMQVVGLVEVYNE